MRKVRVQGVTPLREDDFDFGMFEALPDVLADDKSPVLAAIDLGTNNCRLLIAEPSRHGGLRVIDAYSRMTRLGEGLATTGSLSPAAITRTMEALKVSVSRIRRRRVTDLRAIATEACRRALNGPDFLVRVKDETGLDFDVITPAEEARLAVSGCTSLLDPDRRTALIFDIGGGSTELAWINVLGPDRAEMVDWVSLPIGVVTLAERHGDEVLHGEGYHRVVAEVEHAIAPFAKRYGMPAPEIGFQILGTSGTVTTLAAMHMELPRYDRVKVDGAWLERDQIAAVIRVIQTLDLDSRLAHPCIGAERADLLLPGCAILEAILDAWPQPRLRIADRGLREGVLLDLMQRAVP